MNKSRQLSRRTLAKGGAWSIPVLMVGAAAPAFAASLRKDPGINGWVLNTPRSLGDCAHTLEVNSAIAGKGPDGAPFGLYLYNIADDAVITSPSITYWIIGNQRATWTSLSGHSTCWAYQGRGTPQAKRDGFTYTPYTWSYTCTVNPADRQTGADGVERLFLGNFHVRASFTQPSTQCDNVTYWTQRAITIDPDGPNGAEPAERLTFERRNGSLGPFRSGARAQRLSSNDSPSSTPAESSTSAASEPS